ncbi:MAG: undecaprenyl-phosphate glucose phosphotransferase [Hyphomicrobiales bacterium]
MDKFDSLHNEDVDVDTDIIGMDGDDGSAPARPDELFTVPSEMERDDVARLLAQKTMSPAVVAGFIVIFELILVVLSGALSIAFDQSEPFKFISMPTGVLFGVTVLFSLLVHALHLDTLRVIRDLPQQLMRIVATWMVCFSTVILSSQMLPELNLFDTRWVTPWFIMGFALVFSFRFFAGFVVKKWTEAGLLERRAIIVGGGEEAEQVILGLERQQNNDIRICGIFDDRTDDRSPDTVAGYPKLGTVPELVEFARSARLDMLIVSLPLTAGGRVRQMLKKLWILPLDIRLSAHTNKMAFKQRAYSYIGAMPFVNLAERPIAGWRFVRKRIFDVIFSILMIVALSPLMAVTAIMIKLDSKGPVFFRQKRHGFNNEVIDVWKFRSMYTDMCDPTAKVVVTKGDPRVTKVGAFIRKTSIDELPQLWNVLKGELSLVGPRPHAVHAHLQDQPWNEVVDGYFARHRVKPGVTGWAQINGWRGEIDNVEKIKKRTDHDLYYIENWSLAFDLYILFQTPLRLMDTKNAY